MKELLKSIAPRVRELGFRGSGQNYRRVDGDFVFVINFQGSHGGEKFYVNLGAQPTFVPTAGTGDLKTLKEYECIFRRRVGKGWSWSMPDLEIAVLVAEITEVSSEFFSRAATLRDALARDSVSDLLQKFGLGTTSPCTALNLARGAQNLGLFGVANALALHGLSISNERSVGLIADLNCIVNECAVGYTRPTAPTDVSGAAEQ